MESYDVIIVGSGPAGSSAGKALKGSGLRVLVIEKKKLPRYKMCSGMLFPDTLSFLRKNYGEIPDNVLCHPELYYKGMKMVFPGGQEAEIPLGPISSTKDHELLKIGVARRTEFDYWLLKESGVLIKDECRLKGFKVDKEDITLNVIQGDKEIELRTRYLIGADGASSRIRDVIYPEFRNEVGWLICYDEIWTGSVDLDPKYFWGFADRSFSEFYAGLSTRDNTWIPGTVLKKGSDVKPYFDTFIEHLKKEYNFRPDKMIGKTGCMVNTFPNKFYLGESNVILAGDAGCFMNLVGEGISSALSTGSIAGKSVIESIKSKDDLISVYADLVQGEMNRTLGQHELGKKMGFDVFF